MNSRIAAWILLPMFLLASYSAQSQGTYNIKSASTPSKAQVIKVTRGKILQYLNRQRSEGATIQLTKELGYNFSGLDLSNINFSKVEMVNADFSNSNLSGSDFSNAFAEDCNFSGANLDKVNFSNSTIASSKFVGSSIKEAIFNSTFAKEAIFNEADLSKSLGTNSNFEGANFISANLTHTSFQNGTQKSFNTDLLLASPVEISSS
jgi:uncharacterized protein YjbI with pentapeptide repeats